MNKGIPNCPDCGGKGMCDKHKLEYLKYESDMAKLRYEAEYIKQLKKQSSKQK